VFVLVVVATLVVFVLVVVATLLVFVRVVVVMSADDHLNLLEITSFRLSEIGEGVGPCEKHNNIVYTE